MNADCGVTFDHEPHVYKTPRGKIKACDGSVTKCRFNDDGMGKCGVCPECKGK